MKIDAKAVPHRQGEPKIVASDARALESVSQSDQKEYWLQLEQDYVHCFKARSNGQERQGRLAGYIRLPFYLRPWPACSETNQRQVRCS